ncbi:GH92 family glycosyl hydrolase [Microvirga sp. STR05]|uniref:Glycoside hydrolase family 92 protein n=1 Tax=Hymenobacter duratus TaxID=2771356 RepID=A0ABR8JIB6_9BACT|nr:GH92 family glycosyl hydrolase [Hymenobacter duratus]MBD2715468.1 glycoside hydrolase family 92 protein [Hymenobacter duratus]MBR7950376.1 GH92 family glycosyl hydrolase [Microvirga sp. STR05]
MKLLLLAALLLATVPTFAQKAKPTENLVQYAKPLVGTARMGHTYPGATVPFGMVQLSPDTDTLSYEQNGKYNPRVYEYCAGYQYADKTIVGFSHTHFSGTGHSDLGDFLLMPTTGPLQLNPGTADQPERGFRSRFSHQNEVAEPAYYRVKLDDHNIVAELTASNRVGMHQYTFPQSEQAHIILDLTAGIYNYPDKNVWTFVRVENDTLVTGYRQTHGWARTRTEYFAMSFSKPFVSYGSRNLSKKQVYRGFWGRFDQTKNFPELAGEQLRLFFDFKTTAGEKVKVKMALSGVSTEGALRNMRAEVPGWDFEAVKRAGQALWQQELSKVVVESPKRVDKENFYTAMYHAALSPTTYMDVDGQYRGLDQNIHKAEGFTNYTSFSLWDTYRALHPLYNLLQPKRNADMVQSMLAHFDQSTMHMLPIWSHYANENWCMIGYHSVPVIVDAVLKGVVPADQAQRALDACVTTAHQQRYDGIGLYEQLGYVPEDKSGASVSKTLEYAYDDWCIAQLARKLGKTDIEAEFSKRAQNWQNVYDARINFMRPRLADGSFRPRFDVLSTHDQGFIEGNAWNYSLYVPQDPAALIAKMGGEKKFLPHLDSLFTMHLPDKFFAETEDITRDGIIGNYVHGNEPAHHVAYLYNWTSQPYQTQARVRMILPKMYRPTPDGLGGNDDCGQMSAWYIFSALGFYPVAPGSPEYALGSPAVYGATINLENGNAFRITVKNQSDRNVYVKEARLNGQKLTRPFLQYADVVKGGELVFTMAGKP